MKFKYLVSNIILSSILAFSVTVQSEDAVKKSNLGRTNSVNCCVALSEDHNSGLTALLSTKKDLVDNNFVEEFTPNNISYTPKNSLEDCLESRYNFNAQDLSKYKGWLQKGMKHTEEGGITIFVDKAAYEMDLYVDGDFVKTYPIDLGWNPFDDKGRNCQRVKKKGKTLKACTPEGIFKARYKGSTKFYKALLLNVCDGCLYEIHGKGDGKKGGTWTHGCVAVSNSQMDDLLDHIGLEKEGERLDRMGRKSKKKARGIERDLRIVVVKYGLRDDYCNLR